MQKIFIICAMVTALQAASQNYYLLIGTYTRTTSKGIYVYSFNATDGSFKWVSNTDSLANPSYLAISPNQKFVYAVSETGGQTPGAVCAFSFDKPTGTLKMINRQLSGGDGPCYVAVSKRGNWVTVGNYGGGTLAALKVKADGSLAAAAQVISHKGKSINPDRQAGPHVHATVFSPMNDFLFVPDLGLDKIMTYKFNPAALKPLKAEAPVIVPAGTGPRHFTFHPNGRFAYLIQEMSGSVTAYSYSKGKLKAIQSLLTHPQDFGGKISSADVHLSPDGRFLYASNRGDENNIAIFSVSPTSGKLTLKGYQTVQGKTPRNFVIDPTGNFLLVANQNSDNVVIFKRNTVTGLLSDTSSRILVPMPVCLQMVSQ